MATPTTIYIHPQQRKKLFQRARRRKTSFSEELRAALDFYLDLPPDFDKGAFTTLVRDAHASLNRSIARIDAASAKAEMAGRKLIEIDRRLDELAQNRI
jgi:hypothetical protein